MEKKSFIKKTILILFICLFSVMFVCVYVHGLAILYVK